MSGALDTARAARLAAETIPAPAGCPVHWCDLDADHLGNCQSLIDPNDTAARYAAAAAAAAATLVDGRCVDCMPLAEPEPIHRALARATRAEQRLEDLERRLFDLTEEAAALALSWEAAAVKRAAEGDDAGAALIRGFIADQEHLFAGLTGESAGAGGEA